MAEDRRRCLEAGFDDHLAKPFGAGELLADLAAKGSARPRKLSRRAFLKAAGALALAQVAILDTGVDEDHPDLRDRIAVSPLGCGALAGTAFNVNRESLALALGFDIPAENSLDSVSDRDFALEFMSAASILMMHLSRFSEESIDCTTAFSKSILDSGVT